MTENGKPPSRGILSDHRYLCSKAMRLQAVDMKSRRRCHQKMQRRRTEDTVTSDPWSTASRGPRPAPSKPADPGSAQSSRDSWELDSGFCSEASPPASGRASPCPGLGSGSAVVALDCEMVGTGPGGCHSELARCSVLDYDGNVLYDEYVRPCSPVTNYRTRWSGIQRHHLLKATPFVQARQEITRILEGKVVVGHSICNDFKVLDIAHPCHMVRDTCTTRLLSRLAGFPGHQRRSLKVLAAQLLHRKIQVGSRGHCSVEDAQAALDLYKLVEVKWEQDLQNNQSDSPEPSPASSDHYMRDEYWPDDVTADGQ